MQMLPGEQLHVKLYPKEQFVLSYISLTDRDFLRLSLFGHNVYLGIQCITGDTLYTLMFFGHMMH